MWIGCLVQNGIKWLAIDNMATNDWLSLTAGSSWRAKQQSPVQQMRLIQRHLRMEKNGKSVPLAGPRFPEGSRSLRFPDYVTMAQDGGKVVSLTHRPLFTPSKYSWYSFLLEAESTPGPWCDRKDYVNEKFQWHHLESNQRHSDLVLTTVLPRPL